MVFFILTLISNSSDKPQPENIEGVTAKGCSIMYPYLSEKSNSKFGCSSRYLIKVSPCFEVNIAPNFSYSGTAGESVSPSSSFALITIIPCKFILLTCKIFFFFWKARKEKT